MEVFIKAMCKGYPSTKVGHLRRLVPARAQPRIIYNVWCTFLLIFLSFHVTHRRGNDNFRFSFPGLPIDRETLRGIVRNIIERTRLFSEKQTTDCTLP